MKDRFYVVETYIGGDKQWYWRLIAPNNKILAVAGEGFVSRSNAVRNARRVADTFRYSASLCFNDGIARVRPTM